jgi:hypothetical protein
VRGKGFPIMSFSEFVEKGKYSIEWGKSVLDRITKVSEE